MSFDCDEAWLNFCTNSNNTETASIIERENVPIINSIIPKCSNLYISTTTKISYFDKGIDLFKTFWDIPIISYSHYGSGCVKKQIKYTLKSEKANCEWKW